MKTTYVYPGTFSPPTYGHLNIAVQAARIFPDLIIICSENPCKKEVWFSPDECKALWQSYKLPNNVSVMTLSEFKSLSIKSNKIVMVRGLRGPSDLEPEEAVMLFNKKHFGISKYFYIFCADKYKNISSSLVRLEATNLNLRNLSNSISPLIISSVLEKCLNLKNIFLVVGRPGSGKSTFLKMLNEISAKNYVINTDGFNKQLRPLLKEAFGEEDLIKVAINNEAKMKKIISSAWIKLLEESLCLAPAGSNVFVEIAYGLQPDKLMFRFVGGKIIYIGCEDENKNLDRITNRGTPELAVFIKKILDKLETSKITKKYCLATTYVDTSCSLKDLTKSAKLINKLISGG